MTPDEQIDRYIATLFGKSDPGDALHQLLLASTSLAEARPGLQVPDPDTWKVSITAISPGSLQSTGTHPDEFVHLAVVRSILELRQEEVIHFALLVREVSAVPDDGNEVSENLSRRLHADGNLQDHPNADEVTRLYAACRDGRRWTGQHFLTGSRAGTILGPTVHVGAVAGPERGRVERALRVAVGITNRMTGPEAQVR